MRFWNRTLKGLAKHSSVTGERDLQRDRVFEMLVRGSGLFVGIGFVLLCGFS